jgi:hypothetical protein
MPVNTKNKKSQNFTDLNGCSFIPAIYTNAAYSYNEMASE